MDPKGFLLDKDRGVSPVIGVILMVAITVILAAVIATFVMNMGPTETTMPNTQWNFDEDDSSEEVAISHNGGGPVKVSNLQIKVTDGSNSASKSFTDAGYASNSELTAGDEAVLAFDSASGSQIGVTSLNYPDAEIDIIWENPDSGETQIMADWEN